MSGFDNKLTVRSHRQPGWPRPIWRWLWPNVPQNVPNLPPKVGYDGSNRQFQIQPENKKKKTIIKNMTKQQRFLNKI